MTYWADGRLKDVTDPRGFVTRFDVDWTNRQNIIKFALGTSLEQTVKETFDTVGFITESIDGLNHKVTYVPDSFHRLSQIKDHYGTVKLTNTFDNLSQVTHQADGLSETTEYKIDELFRVYKIIDPNGNSTQTQFDANDHWDQRGHSLFSLLLIGKLAEE